MKHVEKLTAEDFTDLEDIELYEYADEGRTLIQLTVLGAKLAREAGLTVDVDCYGCAFVKEACYLLAKKEDEPS